jgi:membrane-bound lytic murein transglycosylase D
MVYRRIHLLGILAAAMFASSCGSAQKPMSALPARQANAPALLAQATPTADPAASDTASGPEQEAIQSQAKPQSQQPTKPGDPVADLIAQVEKEYQAGQASYAAGNHDAAQESFDHAFDLLLSSPLDLHSDARLMAEFNRILENVNQLEMADLKNEDSQGGDQKDAQKSEPAPIDETNDVAYPVDPNVKAAAEAELKATHSDLPLMLTDPVASYINYFSTRGRGVIERALVRSGRYQTMMQSILKEEGVPQDLIYLAQAESGFHPTALSRAGARGIWQFMASRAKGYGLERNPWMDERQDPEKSTRAAAHHLKDLYNQFGDWYLAMAAYNSGPGTVQSAVKRTGYADFWQLYDRNVLPKETRNYVPIILAMTIMAKNPEQYGLAGLQREAPVPYDTVMIDYAVDLRLVAECVNVPAETLQDLNPALLRLTTPPGKSYELHLPQGTKQQYETAIAQIPEDMRVWWRYHQVAPGDTLASIAHTYHVTPRAIAQTNHFDDEGSPLDKEDLVAGNKLIIPVEPGRRLSDSTQAYAKHLTVYKIRRGDTVEKVADNFGVSPAMVRRWNHLKGDSLGKRHVLYVHLPVVPNPNAVESASLSSPRKHSSKKLHTANTVVRHRVQQGETLTSIASSNHTTVKAIQHDNGNLAVLRPGMILILRDMR